MVTVPRGAYLPLCHVPGEACPLDRSHEVVLIARVTMTVKVARPALPQPDDGRPGLHGARQEMVFAAHDRAFAFFVVATSLAFGEWPTVFGAARRTTTLPDRATAHGWAATTDTSAANAPSARSPWRAIRSGPAPGPDQGLTRLLHMTVPSAQALITPASKAAK